MKFFMIGMMFAFAIGGSPVFAEGDKAVDLDWAQVVAVKAVRQGRAWSFSVTVRHHDQGWDHYANVWQVIDPETETVLAERVLAHPHDNEQPFTRSLSNISFPEGMTLVTVRAGCTVHGFGGTELTVDLSPGAENPDNVTVQ